LKAIARIAGVEEPAGGVPRPSLLRMVFVERLIEEELLTHDQENVFVCW
jgi:hypothetical protein